MKKEKKSDAEEQALAYQLHLLEGEIENINTTIARMDEMAQASKNWAISIWTGSIAIMLSQSELREYILVSAIPPFLFWYLDAYFRRLQTRSIYRTQKIREFLNSTKLSKSFQENKLVDFIILDPTGTQYKGEEEYEKLVSMKRTMKFREVRSFYITLILISLGLGAFILLS